MKPIPADVILYPVTGRSGWTSRLVAAGEMLEGMGEKTTQYSHAAILISDGYQFEAKWPRTGIFPIDVSRPYEIWRIGNPSQEQRHRIINWCNTNEGELYNMLGLLTFGLLGLPRTAVCSQAVGFAYGAAGIHLGKEGQRLLSPNAIPDARGAKMILRYTPEKKRK